MGYVSGFLLGLILSFFGQLPLGTMSMTATQIAVQEDFKNAWMYSFGVALIEMVYLRAVLSGIEWILRNPLFFELFNWLALIFFLTLGVLSFISANRQDPGGKALLLKNKLNRFLLGMSMSALNPAQIPFWFIWTGYFLNMGWLPAGTSYFNFFTLGSGIGTLGGLAVYMYGGNWLVSKWNTSNRVLNRVMGLVFILAALLQLSRIIWS